MMLFGWTMGVGDGQGGLACCSSWGHKESDTTERLKCTEPNRTDYLLHVKLGMRLKQLSRTSHSSVRMGTIHVGNIYGTSLCFLEFGDLWVLVSDLPLIISEFHYCNTFFLQQNFHNYRRSKILNCHLLSIQVKLLPFPYKEDSFHKAGHE